MAGRCEKTLAAARCKRSSSSPLLLYGVAVDLFAGFAAFFRAVTLRRGRSMRRLTKRRAALVVLGLAATTASAGCALIADLSQFDGYVDASTDGSVEAASDAPVADELPAIVDTGSAETSDGGPDDAGDGGDAPLTTDGPTGDAPSLYGTSWCSTNIDEATVLCADFDERTTDKFETFPYGGAWLPNQLGGTDGIDRADFAVGSAPASVEIVTACTMATMTPGCITGGNTQEQLITTVTAPHGILFSYALKIEDFDLDASDVSTVVVANLPSPSGSPDWQVSLDYKGGNNAGSDNQLLESHIDDAGGKTYAETAINFPDFTNQCLGGSDDGGDAGSTDDEGGAISDGGDGGDGASAADSGVCIGGWVNFQVMVDLVGTSAACTPSGGPCVTITYDGVNAIVGGGSVIPITPPVSVGTLQIIIGANYIQAPAQSMTLLYDNVKAEALP
jgi:hypothetical protein